MTLHLIHAKVRRWNSSARSPCDKQTHRLCMTLLHPHEMSADLAAKRHHLARLLRGSLLLQSLTDPTCTRAHPVTQASVWPLPQPNHSFSVFTKQHTFLMLLPAACPSAQGTLPVWSLWPRPPALPQSKHPETASNSRAKYTPEHGVVHQTKPGHSV